MGIKRAARAGLVCGAVAIAAQARAATLYVSWDNTSSVSAYPNAGAGGSTYTGTPDNTFVTGLEHPRGIAIDPAGNVFVIGGAPGSSQAVYSFSSTGVAGPSSQPFAYLNVGLAAFGSNALFASSVEASVSSYQGSVTQLTENGIAAAPTVGASYNTGPTTTYTESEFDAIGSYDGHQYLYVANYQSDQVVAFDLANLSAGIAYTLSNVFSRYGPMGLAVDPRGNVWVDNGGGSILELTGSGANPIANSAPITITGGTSVADPESMAFGPDGDLYFCDPGEGAVLRLDTTTGIVSDYITYSGDGPNALAFSPEPGCLTLMVTAAAAALLRRRRVETMM